VRKGGKKGGPKKGHKEHSCSLEHGKKDLSHVKCFKCHKMGHYASQCPKKKKAKNKQQKQFAGSAEASKVDELASKLETTFSMVSCLSTNTISGVGWYVDNGASRHMTFNKKAFNRLQEQEVDIQVELGDDATYPSYWNGICLFLHAIR
jgi:hypothetical protein